MAKMEVFEDQVVEEEQHNDKGGDEENYILNLPTNTIPKGVVALERLFDLNPQVKEKLSLTSDKGKYEKVNIGEDGEKKCIYIGKSCTVKEKKVFSKLSKSTLMLMSRDTKTSKLMCNIPFRYFTKNPNMYLQI